MGRVLAYKLARPDGFDFYTSKTINYRENIGRVVKPPNPNASLGLCSSGVLHASHNPNDCFAGAKIPCSAYRVSGIPACGNKEKWGFTELRVIREIPNLDKLFGWRYSEATNPIHPFKLPKVTQVTEEHLELMRKWGSVRDLVGTSVFDSVWDSARGSVRDLVWTSVLDSVRNSIRGSVIDSIRGSVIDSIRGSVLNSARDSVWAYIGSFFSNIKRWKYVECTDGIYPFQSVVDLWQQGIVPSFDGKLWRLHSGEKADIVWEGKLQ